MEDNRFFLRVYFPAITQLDVSGQLWSGSTVVCVQCVPQLVRFQNDSSQLNDSVAGGFVLGDEHSDEGALTRICKGIEI